MHKKNIFRFIVKIIHINLMLMCQKIILKIINSFDYTLEISMSRKDINISHLNFIFCIFPCHTITCIIHFESWCLFCTICRKLMMYFCNQS